MEASGTRVDWAVASQSKHADAPNGDGYSLVKSASILTASVTDGSGSGRQAHHASNECLRLQESWGGRDIAGLIGEMHKALVGSRGAAICLSFLDFKHNTLTWAAVGDVDGTLCSSGSIGQRRCVIQQGGILGLSLPPVRPHSHPICNGDLIVLASDGVSRRYRKSLRGNWGAEEAVKQVSRNHVRQQDDSTVLALKVQAR